MTALVELSLLFVAYVLEVLMLILIMNVPNNCFMLWMIMFKV
jgi:hypothetical protein